MAWNGDNTAVEANAAAEDWPAEVDLILSAMDAAHPAGGEEHRALERFGYRAKAALKFFADEAGTRPWVLYTRDVNARSLGFITRHRLPLGYGGTVELNGPDGQKRVIHCTLCRCREASAGWFEGALHFNREQTAFQMSAGGEE